MDNHADRMRSAVRVSSVIESRVQAGSGPRPGTPGGEPSAQSPAELLQPGERPGRASREEPASAYPLDALHSLAASLETSCEDLFAAAPFAGDQETGCSIDALVDQVVACLRSLQSEADDLRRVMAIAQERAVGGGERGASS